jgi:hypothetical protein
MGQPAKSAPAVAPAAPLQARTGAGSTVLPIVAGVAIMLLAGAFGWDQHRKTKRVRKARRRLISRRAK